MTRTNETLGRERAEAFRAAHHLGAGPIKDVFELVHSTLGIDVLSMDAPQAEHGLTMKDMATGAIVIAVATTPHPMRQRASVLHEVGHVIAGDVDGEVTAKPGDRAPSEIQADAFARHLLLPLDTVKGRYSTGGVVSETDLSDLVQEFEVSPAIAAIQLHEAGRIDADRKAQWMSLTASHLATTYGWLSQYRILSAESLQPRAPQRLMSRAVAGYHAGVVDLAEVARWYGQDADTLAEELDSHPHDQTVEPGQDVELDDDWHEPLFPNSQDASS